MNLEDFDIDFIKFKNENHTFHFKIEDTFFLLKENSLYEHGNIDVTVACEKQEANIKIDYTLNGHMKCNCERCLRDIKVAVDVKRNDVLKLTGNDDLLAEENYLSVNYQRYNVYDSIYQEICLAMPTRLICANSISKQNCEIDHAATDSEPVIDERWSELKKLIK